MIIIATDDVRAVRRAWAGCRALWASLRRPRLLRRLVILLALLVLALLPFALRDLQTIGRVGVGEAAQTAMGVR